MKKIISVILITFTLLSVLPAADGTTEHSVIPAVGDTFGYLIKPYQPLTARALGMGSAGVALPGRSDTFYINPAALASNRLQISVPSLQVTMYHLYDMVKTGGFSMAGLTGMVSGIQEGYGKLADINAGLSFTTHGFGFGVNTTISLNTFGTKDNYGPQADLFAQVNAAISLGYGYRFELPAGFSLDVGALVRFNYLAYTDTFNASEFINAMNNGGDVMSIINGKQVMAGFSVPFDIGITANMPLGFSAGLVARNINGKFYMTGFPGYNDFLANPFGGEPEVSEEGDSPAELTKFNFSSDWSLDLGFGWSYDTWYLSPTVALDFTDLVGMFTTKDFDFKDFMMHVNVGAEVRVLSFLDVRAGLSQGYWSIGLGLDLWGFKVDAAYYRQEFGETAGQHGLDGFTVRINIGYDR